MFYIGVLKLMVKVNTIVPTRDLVVKTLTRPDKFQLLQQYCYGLERNNAINCPCKTFL